MSALTRSSSALLFVALAAVACKESIEAPTVSPEGPQEELPSYVRFQLSRSLYDPAQPVEKLPVPKVTVTPAVPFTVSIASPYTVDVDFQRPLAPATEYTVTLASGLTSLDGKAKLKSDVTSRFRTPLNRLVRVRTAPPERPGEGEQIDLDEKGGASGAIAGLGPTESVFAEFRFPVSPAQAKALIKLYRKDGPPVEAEMTETQPSQTVRLWSKNGWPRDTPLVLSVDKGLGVAQEGAGTLVTAKAQSAELRTWGATRVVEGPSSAEGGCVPTKGVRVEFNNPVQCAQALAALSIDAPGVELRCVGSDAQPASRTLRAEAVPPLPGSTEVTLTVAKGLKDEFGELLSADSTFKFLTCLPGEQFAYQKPFVILDPGQPAEHVERVRAAAQVKVEAKRVSLPAMWKVVEQQNLGDQVAWTELPWWLEWGDEWGEGDGKKPGEMNGGDIAELDGAQSMTIPVEQGGADWTDVPVPLAQFLGGRKGLVLMRVTPLAADGKPAGPARLRVANVTDLGLTVRASRDTLVVLAARYSDGKPVAGAKIAVFSTDGRALGNGETGPDGLLSLPANAIAAADLHRTSMLIAATKDEDESFVWSRFVTEHAYGSDGPQLVGLVYPDRGIYRPGEKVRLRGVARFATAKGFSSPGSGAKLTVEGPDGTSILSEDVLLSEYGSFAKELAIDKAAKVGDYVARLTIGSSSIDGAFKVGEFRRAEMKVEIQAPSTVAWGDTLKAIIQGDYLFGAPASNLPVRWSLTRTASAFRSARFPSVSFADPNRYEWQYHDEVRILADGEGTLDDEGTFTLHQPLRLPEPVAQREILGISATVDDVSGQSVSRQGRVELFSTEALVGLDTSRYLIEAKKPYAITAVAVTPDDEPAAGVEVVVRSRQHSWRSVRRAGPGGGYYWTSERIVEEDVERCRGKTDANGRVSCQWTPAMGGSLQLVAEAKDSKGRTARAGSWHWIYGDPDYWGSEDSSQVGVLFEKGEVEAGQPIKVAITSPFREGTALVTVEREDILWQKSFPVGASAQLEIPTNVAWAPNVHVVATVVRGRVPTEPGAASDPDREKPAYAVGRREVKVTPKHAALEVKVAVAQPRLEPGQEQRASATITGPDGKPVEGAEVNLWAVDEGVLMLTAYETPDLLASMFRPRGYTTLGLDTRAYILGRRTFIEPVIKGEEDGGGGGEDGDESARRNFDPLAVWVASAITDANGRVEAAFKVPDNLTTYRVMAVAVTKDDRFGRGHGEFKVNKTLMLRQALPRFARPGDRLRAGVLVNHMAPEGGKVVVSLDSIDEKLFSVTGPRRRELELKGGQTASVLFDFAVADAEGAAEMIFSAQMGAHRDKVELKIPVNRLTPRESIAASGVVSSGTFEDTLKVPELARAVSFQVNVSGLPVSSMEGRLRDLVGYPYGCLEQKTSKVLPMIAVRKLADDLKLASIPTGQIKGWVDEYLGIIPKFRCSDGGFDYWEGCGFGSSTYLTSYALEGMLTAKKFGYAVDEKQIATTVDYLRRQVQAGSKGKDQYEGHGHADEAFTGALRVLAEAGSAEPQIEKAAYDGRGKLPLFAKTDLARAMAYRLGPDAKADPSVKTLLGEIGAAGRRKDDRLTFAAEDPDRYWYAWESDQQNTALALRTFLQIDPADGRIPLMIKGLVELDGESEYYATQSLTQTLLGLSEAITAMKPTNTAKASVTAAGQSLAKAENLGTAVRTFDVPAQKLSREVPVTIANEGSSPVFFGAFLTYGYPATARLPARSSGFTLKREYLGRDGRPLPVTRKGDVGELKLRAGEFVTVRLQVQPDEEGRLVVIEDPLPAGLEVVDASLATADQEMARRMGDDAGGQWWNRFHRELRDDRVEWHFERIYRQPFTLQYVARAVTAGTFHAPGSHAERMYQPHLNGRAESLDVVVAPKE